MYKLLILLILLIIIFRVTHIIVLWYNGSGMWIDNLDDNLVSMDKLDNIIYHNEKNIISTEEAFKIKKIIIENKKKWVCKKVVLYTFGGVSYLGDKLEKNKVYKSNNFMRSLFSDLYDKLLENLRSMLKKNVVYKEDAYLPGFHIFKSTYLFQYPIAEFHVDRQHTRNTWSEDCDLEKTISFTLPIDLPKDFSGLYLFNSDKTCKNRVAASQSKRSLIKYIIGRIVLHSGNNYHIMKPSKILNNEYRITLQGHGVLCNNTWYIFW
jgi:hypothetical protein